jgi:hypothetical protein
MEMEGQKEILVQIERDHSMHSSKPYNMKK